MRHEAGRIANNIAKLPQLLQQDTPKALAPSRFVRQPSRPKAAEAVGEQWQCSSGKSGDEQR
jgi:hypothetical protein